MGAIDLHAAAAGWVAGEIARQCMGEEFGWAVQCGTVVAQTPAGPRQVPAWTLLLTARNPLAGEGPLYHGPVAVGAPAPAEADVRAAVTDGLRQLRDLAQRKVTQAMNGKAGAR